MGLEDLTGAKYLNALNASNPDGSGDRVNSLDNHMRGVKNVLLQTFPNVNGPVLLTPAEFNVLDGISTSVTTTDIEKTQYFDIDTNGMLFAYGQKVVNKTGDFTLALADMGKNLDCEKATAFTVTVPTNASVALPVGYSVTIVQAGAGTVTVSPAGGVTVRSVDSNTALRKQWSGATLYKRATDEWVLVGDLQ